MPRKTLRDGIPHVGDHPGRFNEAAARCRGKPAAATWCGPATGRFNEAAARCRGKPTNRRSTTPATWRFNEAAARCRGKPITDWQVWRLDGELQ